MFVQKFEQVILYYLACYQFLVKEYTQVMVNLFKIEPDQEKWSKLNWPARQGLNSVDWAVKLQPNRLPVY